MPKNPKPLHLLVHNSLLEAPEIQELIKKGHSVDTYDGDHDIILAPNAWRMTPALLKHVDVVVKAARSVKYPKEKSE